MAEQENNNDYILLYHRGKQMSIKKFMERNFIYGIEPQELFDFNKDFIWTQMSDSDKRIEAAANGGKYPKSADDLTIDAWLPSPCKLKINPSNVTAEIAINQTNAQVNTSDYYAFADEKIQDIFQNEGYKIASTTKRSIDCQVFGWFKSLYYLGLSDDGTAVNLDKKLIEFADLSRHVISLSTMTSKDGGSFTIKLPIINADLSYIMYLYSKDKKDKTINRNAYNILGRADKNKHQYDFGNNRSEYYSKSRFNSLESNYFNWLISSNDLLFISFEKLEMELERSEVNKTKDITGKYYEVGDKDLFDINTIISNGVYDMIGLVDDVKVVTNPSSSEAFLEVTGRDLMKLLIEDGSFFFNPSTTSDPSSVFQNEQSYGKQGDVKEADQMNNTYNNPINRLRRVSGEIDIFANRINMDIGYVLKGVISQLANVEIVPSYVFDSWGDERTKYIELQPKEEK